MSAEKGEPRLISHDTIFHCRSNPYSVDYGATAGT